MIRHRLLAERSLLDPSFTGNCVSAVPTYRVAGILTGWTPPIFKFSFKPRTVLALEIIQYLEAN